MLKNTPSASGEKYKMQREDQVREGQIEVRGGAD